MLYRSVEIIVEIGRRRTSFAQATGLWRWVSRWRCCHQVCLGIRKHTWGSRSNTGLVFNRLALVTIVVRRSAGRVRRPIWCSNFLWELAGKLLLYVRVI